MNHRAAKLQPNRAKRMECVELAPAFEPPTPVRKRQQAGRTPYASRGGKRCKIQAARELGGLLRHKCLGLGASLVLGAWSLELRAAAPTPAQIQFFENRIRPILVDTCYKCHIRQAERVTGGLLLGTRYVV